MLKVNQKSRPIIKTILIFIFLTTTFSCGSGGGSETEKESDGISISLRIQGQGDYAIDFDNGEISADHLAAGIDLWLSANPNFETSGANIASLGSVKGLNTISSTDNLNWTSSVIATVGFGYMVKTATDKFYAIYVKDNILSANNGGVIGFDIEWDYIGDVPVPPVIASIKPNRGCVGDLVKIKGEKFIKSGTTVSIGGVVAKTVEISEKTITATVPSNGNGKVKVTTSGGSDSYSAFDLVDPCKTENMLFAAEKGSNRVSAIDLSSSQVVYSVPGGLPLGTNGLHTVGVASSVNTGLQVYSWGEYFRFNTISGELGTGSDLPGSDAGTAMTANAAGTKIYVGSTGYITVFSGENLETINHIPVTGGAPYDISLDEGAGLAYTISQNGSLNVINTNTNSVVDSTTVSSASADMPESIYAIPSMDLVYIAFRSDPGYIQAIKKSDLSAITDTAVGSCPRGIGYFSSSGNIYVNNSYSSDYTVIATADHQVVNTFSLATSGLSHKSEIMHSDPLTLKGYFARSLHTGKCESGGIGSGGVITGNDYVSIFDLTSGAFVSNIEIGSNVRHLFYVP